MEAAAEGGGRGGGWEREADQTPLLERSTRVLTRGVVKREAGEGRWSLGSKGRGIA